MKSKATKQSKLVSMYLLFLLLFLSLLARLRIPLMEEDLGCTFFNFIDFVVVTVQVNFIQKVFFIYHLIREFELKFYMKPMLCRIICQFYSMFKMLNKIDFLKIINLQLLWGYSTIPRLGSVNIKTTLSKFKH